MNSAGMRGTAAAGTRFKKNLELVKCYKLLSESFFVWAIKWLKYAFGVQSWLSEQRITSNFILNTPRT